MLTIAELDRMAKDTGCSFHDDCLTCPFTGCIYESRYEAKRMKRELRYAEIRKMARTLSISGISGRLGISKRTVQRALEEQDNG